MKTIMLFLTILLLLMPSIASAQTSGKPDHAGVWAIWAFENYNTAENPWLKGAMIARRWDQIEPSNNVFNFWKLGGDGIDVAIENGYDYVMLKIYVGPASPDWIYDPISEGGGGVPAVYTTPVCYYGQPYPYYLDENYKSLFKRMIDKVKEYIEGLPVEKRNMIVAIQTPIGRSGDSGNYCGTPNDPQYEISDSEWTEYSKEMFGYYYDTYDGTDPPIVPIFHATDWSVDSWLRANTPHHWRKFAWGAHCYQQHNTGEMLIPPSKQYRDDGWAIFTRDEADTFWSNPDGIFSEAPIWFMYWTGLHGLNFGIDFWNIQYINYVDEPGFTEGFDFFNEYAGYHDASESHGAWIALRDSLDANDEVRFPEATYGTIYKWWLQTHENSAQRYIDIANTFSEYGAYQDPNYIPSFWLGSCKLPTQNDVGWDIVEGNFQMYINQIDPQGTSQGYWRVGPTSQPYGRFARGFDHSTGKDAMYFNISDRFFSDQPLNAQYPVTVRVVYFDSGTGDWSLNYDAVGDSQKTACTVTKTNSGLWKERVVTLSDAYFGNLGPQGSDIYLSNTDSEDDIFHMIEIEKSSDPAPTCQSQGYSCCDAPCHSGPHSAYDGDCPGQVCCDECQTCQNQNYDCCSSCEPGTEQPTHDSDCSGQVCCGTCYSPPIPGEYNYSIIRTTTTPSIDGDISEFDNAGVIKLNISATGTTANYSLLWDDDALYIAASFSDAQLNALHTDNDAWLWEDDSLEIMFDTLHNKGSDIQNDDYKFFVNVLNAHLDSQAYDSGWDSGLASEMVASGTLNQNSDTDDGYVVEARIPWWVAGAVTGDVWGMNIQLNDKTASGKSSTQWSTAGMDTNSPDGWPDILFTVRADQPPQDGCIEEHELIPFIDLWRYDSTANPMSEVMEAVTLYYTPGTGCI